MTRQLRHHDRIHRRSGSLLTECVLALGVIMVAVVLLAQLMMTAAIQRRLAEQKRLALEEVANRLERAALLPWSRLTADEIESAPLGAPVQRALQEPKLTATVTDEQAGPVAARRIDVQLAWHNAAGMAVEPVTLSAWRFAAQEETP
ncbi:MAG TPA: hypothetical protein VFB96_06620 [Pirellulaceae bacterium]|nr:hypothetical protein [Pirellulaceae bacterium]